MTSQFSINNKTLEGENRLWESHNALRVLYQSEIVFPESSFISNREKIRNLQRFNKIFLAGETAPPDSRTYSGGDAGLIKILLKPNEDLVDLVGWAEVGHSIGNGVVVFQPQQRRELVRREFFHAHLHVLR